MPRKYPKKNTTPSDDVAKLIIQFRSLVTDQQHTESNNQVTTSNAKDLKLNTYNEQISQLAVPLALPKEEGNGSAFDYNKLDLITSPGT